MTSTLYQSKCAVSEENERNEEGANGYNNTSPTLRLVVILATRLRSNFIRHNSNELGI